LRQATSQSERRFYWFYVPLSFGIVIVEIAVLVSLALCFRQLLTSVAFWATVGLLYIATIFVMIIIGNRMLMKIKLKHGTVAEKRDIEQYGIIQIPIGEAMPSWLPGYVWLLSSMVIPIIVILIFAAIARDWIGVSCLVFASVLLTVLFLRPAKASRDAKSQSKLFLIMLWTVTLIIVGAWLLRGEFWIKSLMPGIPQHLAYLPRLIAFAMAAFKVLLSLCITVGQRLSRIKHNNTQGE
jgi:hypothetical protein